MSPRDIPTLIVDDEPDIRLLMRVGLELANEGLRVSGEAASGEEALGMLESCDARVVVLDQMMPGLTGLATASRIREQRPNLRLILCTAYYTGDLARQAADVGIESCVSKDDIGHLPDEVRRVAALA